MMLHSMHKKRISKKEVCDLLDLVGDKVEPMSLEAHANNVLVDYTESLLPDSQEARLLVGICADLLERLKK